MPASARRSRSPPRVLFNLNALSNAFTVTTGKSLTLSTPFAFGALDQRGLQE
jgi:hypothetical protein